MAFITELSKTTGVPLVDQIVNDFELKISSRKITSGKRLPSVRDLASRLDVSIFTVVTAYDRLVAAGVVESRRGSGFFVTGRFPASVPAVSPSKKVPLTNLELLQQVINHEAYDLAPGAGFFPSTWVSDAVPPAMWAKVARTRAQKERPNPPEGAREFREQIAIRLRQNGVEADAERIVTTYGVGHAVDLICRSQLKPGDAVVVEDPSYFMLHMQLRDYGLILIAVTREIDGPDVDMLERVAMEHKPKAFFTQTVLHNPVGGSTSSHKCHRILSLAEQYQFFVVEDDIYGELSELRLPRLASLDCWKHVIYISSFSKVLSAGIRVGYAVLPDEKKVGFVRQKVANVLVSSAFVEMVVAEALSTGHFRHHVEKLRVKANKARSLASRLLTETGVDVLDKDHEGIFLWGRMPRGVDVGDLVQRAHDSGILLAHGRLFSPSGELESFLRFSPATSVDPRLLKFLSNVLSPSEELGLRLVGTDHGAAA